MGVAVDTFMNSIGQDSVPVLRGLASCAYNGARYSSLGEHPKLDLIDQSNVQKGRLFSTTPVHGSPALAVVLPATFLPPNRFASRFTKYASRASE